MPRRIELELTSARDDGSWTWRAAGALQPRGELDGGLLPQGAKVGDVLRAEADFHVDGITVLSVLPPKATRAEPERIELRPAAREFQPVVTTLAARTERRGRPSRGDRFDGDRPDGPRRDRDRDRGRGEPGGRDDRGRDDRGRAPGDRPARPPRPAGGPDGPTGPRPRRERPAPPPPKPKPKKLRPGRVNRDALLATLPPEHHPIAEQLFRGGIPAVRAAITEQNNKARTEGQPEIPEATVLALAENLAPAVRLADWLDRASAAVADAEVIALKDLRAVVHAADDVVREDATRPVVAELRAVLERRAASEQQEWLDDITASLVGGRVVRALRLASRSPQPNESLPPELATRLAEAAGAALTAEAAPDRWATVLDAVAYSPVRRAVTPVGAPAEPGDELLAAVRKHVGRVPKVGALFGIEAPSRPAPAPRPKSAPRRASEVQAEAGLLPPPAGGSRRIPPPPSPAPSPDRSDATGAAPVDGDGPIDVAGTVVAAVDGPAPEPGADGPDPAGGPVDVLASVAAVPATITDAPPVGPGADEETAAADVSATPVPEPPSDVDQNAPAEAATDRSEPDAPVEAPPGATAADRAPAAEVPAVEVPVADGGNAPAPASPPASADEPSPAVTTPDPAPEPAAAPLPHGSDVEVAAAPVSPTAPVAPEAVADPGPAVADVELEGERGEVSPSEG